MYSYFFKHFRSALIFALLALASLEAEAAWILVGGRLIWASLLCEGEYKGVPNTGANPAAAVCTITATEAQVLCKNPADNNVAPGNSAIQTIFIGSDQIDASDIDARGKAYPQVHIDTDDQLLVPSNCVNPNWNPIAALIYKATMDLKIYECLDSTCSQYGNLKSTTTWNCELPPEYNFDNMPISYQTEYNCTKVTQ